MREDGGTSEVIIKNLCIKSDSLSLELEGGPFGECIELSMMVVENGWQGQSTPG